MLLLRWLGDWVYALWISVVPPKNYVADLACGHSPVGRDLQPKWRVRCNVCGENTIVRGVRRR